jgi:tetratricopeptide (TPR) repeat protein
MRIGRDREQQAKQILQSVPTAAWAWKDLADFYIDHTRWEEAKTTLLDYLQLYPNDYDFAQGCAVSFILARRSADAVEIMEPFLARRPSYDLSNMIGFEYHKLGRVEQAIQMLEASIPLEPDRYDAYYHLGYVYSAAGQPERAIEMFEEVLKRRADFPEITAQINQLRRSIAVRDASERR